eukprot:508867_1
MEYERITPAQADRAQRKIIRIKTIGMNHGVLEEEFIEDNKHCHLCSADMKGPCAFPFREWMGCAAALDTSDPHDPKSTPDLNHKQCQNVLNKYVNCCNRYMVKHSESNSLHQFPWFLWAQRSQMMFSPCAKQCKTFNPFAGRFQYLLDSSTQKCNDCLIDNVRYPWHMFTRTRIEDTYVWKILNEKIDDAENALKHAKNRGWYQQ